MTSCSAVDSPAVFRQRTEELGLGEFLERLTELGWATHGNFSFAVASGPGGAVDDERFVKTVVRPVFRLDADAELPPATAALRRLFFESHTLAVSELRSRTERTDGDAPRKVPQAERETRKEKLRSRLGIALVMEGDLEPSNALIDRFVQMVDENTLTWVPWEEATKRDQELNSTQSRKKWVADANGVVKEKTVKDEFKADVSSALKISWALQRRGLAMEVAGLMSFEKHELITAKLIKAYTKETPDDRYEQPSMEMLRGADREIWKQLSRLSASGVRPPSIADPPPLDLHIQKVLDSVELNMLLLPLARTGGSGAASSSVKGRRTDDLSDQPAGKKTRRAQPAATRKGVQPAAKGKGKSQQRGGGPVPKSLQGGVAALPDGTPICFGYNLKGCGSGLAGGAKCAKGVHLCAKPGCHGKHPMSECPM